jgi:Leucine-rich repeat (LRR) protein
MGFPLADHPRLTTSSEINAVNRRIEDKNLERVWLAIRIAIRIELSKDTEGGPKSLPNTPGAFASANEIRPWLNQESSQAMLKKITYLDLSGHELKSLPEEIGLCTGLKKLYLNSNELYALPKETFEKLTALEELRINGNFLDEIPECLVNPNIHVDILESNPGAIL